MEDQYEPNEQAAPESAIALCASCDRCRARKTKCDGQRPCSNCAAKYMKKNKIARYVVAFFRFWLPLIDPFV